MSSFFIRRPIFAIVISIIIVILGTISLLSLPIAQYPQISPPTVSLSTTYAGANATIVNQTVAQVIEDQLKGVEDMSYMSSTSSNDGSYSLSVVFSLDSDGNTDSINVQNDTNLAKNSLPSDVQTQGLTVRKSAGDMVLMANIYSPNGLMIRRSSKIMPTFICSIRFNASTASAMSIPSVPAMPCAYGSIRKSWLNGA